MTNIREEKSRSKFFENVMKPEISFVVEFVDVDSVLVFHALVVKINVYQSKFIVASSHRISYKCNKCVQHAV